MGLVTAASGSAGADAATPTLARCSQVDPGAVEYKAVAPLILVAWVRWATGDAVVLEPETLLKGEVAGATIKLTRPETIGQPGFNCQQGRFSAGSRVLLFLGNQTGWPPSGDVYVLSGGAVRSALTDDTWDEHDLFNRIRAATGQAGVPVASQVKCLGAGTDADLAARVREASLVIVGTVSSVTDTAQDQSSVEVQPESFLLGNPSRAVIRFTAGRNGPCEGPRFVKAGDRVLVIAGGSGALSWPEPNRVYLFEAGSAKTLDRGDGGPSAEADLIAKIRTQTGQFSVPAASDDDGAGIDWKSTILPIGGAVLGLLAVSLLLMRVWHRIDPS